MKSKKFDSISEEDFLKNRERRNSSGKKAANGKKRKKKSSLNPALKGFLIAFAILIGIIAAFAAAAAIYYFSVVSGDVSDDHNTNNDNFINSDGDEVNRILGEDGSKKYFTFLATATDVGGSLTDVIMVARFNYDEKEPDVSILQIPRDTYVKIALDKLYFTKDGMLSADNFSAPVANASIKINEAFYRGKSLAYDKITELLDSVIGKSESEIDSILKKKEFLFIEADEKKVKSYAKASTDSQKKEIKQNILRDFGLTYLQNLIYYNYGIPTDYRAQVNVKGFRGVVDAIDGVDLYVPQDMNYEDEYQDLYIHLKKGQQHLNGKKAEQFVRFRGYPEGDVARLDAQKRFINAFLDKLLSFSTVTKIDSIISEIQENVYTDISFNNMLRFANKILLMDLKNDVHMYTLPGTGEYIGPVSYFVADRQKTIELINEEFNVFNTPLMDEDFRMVDNKAIYRPAASVTPDPEENTDEENTDDEKSEDSEDIAGDGEGENKDGKDNEDSKDVEGKENEDDEKDTDKNEEDEDTKSPDEENEDIAKEDADKDKGEKDSDVSEKEADETNKPEGDKKENDETKDGEKPSQKPSDDKNNKPETDGNASSAELDDNYKLLIDMAA